MSKEKENWMERFSSDAETKYVSLGTFPKDIVAFVLSKKPAFQGRISDTEEILFWKSRIKHTQRHKKDFASEEEFQQCLKDIPDIIRKPDYISIHPTDESVSFIRQYSKKVSVAIKISTDGKQVYRTMYPLRDSQLNHYVESGRAWKWEKKIDKS